RLVDWIPMGVFLNGADGFIHHGGAGNTLTALYSGIPQIVFGEGADRSVNAGGHDYAWWRGAIIDALANYNCRKISDNNFV
ncbi:glycosyltransferase, partial [Escherichia coli]|uniref:glycosyltransferase n=1 Tax=Escherichia coli TaxID=562 RepID=UPI003EE1DA62